MSPAYRQMIHSRIMQRHGRSDADGVRQAVENAVQKWPLQTSESD